MSGGLEQLGLALLTVPASGGIWLCLRQLIRARAEHQRHLWAERLADQHGPAILAKLPDLARELRDEPTSRVARRRRIPQASIDSSPIDR